MATVNPEKASISHAQDSDELQEMHCEQCERHFNKNVAAEGFCVDCMEYMCQMCLNYHKIYMPQHAFKDKDSMPQDIYFEKCFIHQNLLIKFYCSDCKTFACSECKINSHINCGNVNHLPTIVPGIEQSEEFNDLTKNLDNISSELQNTKEKIESNIKYVKAQEDKAKSTIHKRREEALSNFRKQQRDELERFDKEMEETIARLKKQRKDLIEKVAEKQRNFEEDIANAEKEVTKKVENSKSADLKNLELMQRKNEQFICDMKKQMSDLMQKRNTDQRCQLFVLMKTMEQNVDRLKQDAARMKQNIGFHYYNVETEENMLDATLLESASNLLIYRETNSSVRKRTATFYSALNTTCLGGRSICLLSDKCLLVADYNDSALVSFNNVMQNKCTAHIIPLPSDPWAIAKVEDNKVAVTHPYQGIISLMTFDRSGKVIQTGYITSEINCYGIAYSNKKLIVSYTTSPAKVQILDMSGKVLKIFKWDNSGQRLFKYPHYLAVSPDNQTIYVSDCGSNTVTSLTFDGKVKRVYKDKELKDPYQLTVDECGTVYVCGQSSNNVHQLSSDLTKVKILLDKVKHQGSRLPTSVAYCQNNKRLYVGLWNGTIKLFDLTLD